MVSPAAPDRVLQRLSGLLAVAVALGTAEFVSGLMAGSPSPVVAIGDVVIDFTPGDLARQAIAAFGRNDKPALVIGTTLIALWIGWALGRRAAENRLVGDAGFVVFGVLGVLAASRLADSAAGAFLPSFLGAMAGLVTLRVLLFLTPTVADAVADRRRSGRPQPGAGQAERRVFLAFAGAAGVAAVVLAAGGRRLRDRFSAEKARELVRLSTADRPAAPLPDDVDFDIEGLTSFVTPNDDFYRIDTALTIPQVDPTTWRLRVNGMVDTELEFTYDDVLAMPMDEVDITISCVSNEVGGGLIGNARWLGTRIDRILDEAGVDPDATQLVGRSVDGYTCGFPVGQTRDRDAILAVGMNGEPLPVVHGFPIRMVVPGLYGYVSATKWLAELELATFDDFDQYWVRRGWVEIAPVKTQCRIDTPRGVADAGTIPLAGVAWAPHTGISKVEVRFDEGPWQEAELAGVPGDDTWRQWLYSWDVAPGEYVVEVRATDGEGVPQTDQRAAPFPSGATGYPARLMRIN
jgi:DMSO/TMAO reductase YedYZ molybdopterin-dependent catalytic subunit